MNRLTITDWQAALDSRAKTFKGLLAAWLRRAKQGRDRGARPAEWPPK